MTRPERAGDRTADGRIVVGWAVRVGPKIVDGGALRAVRSSLSTWVEIGAARKALWRARQRWGVATLVRIVRRAPKAELSPSRTERGSGILLSRQFWEKFKESRHSWKARAEAAEKELRELPVRLSEDQYRALAAALGDPRDNPREQSLIRAARVLAERAGEAARDAEAAEKQVNEQRESVREARELVARANGTLAALEAKLAAVTRERDEARAGLAEAASYVLNVRNSYVRSVANRSAPDLELYKRMDSECWDIWNAIDAIRARGEGGGGT